MNNKTTKGIDMIINKLGSMSSWRLLFSVTFAAFFLGVGIASVFSIIFHGRVTYDYLISSIVDAFVVILIVVFIFIKIIERLKETEKALRQSEAKIHTLYNSIYNSISDALFIMDMEGHFIEVNNAACERLGYSREELLKMGPADLDSPVYAAKVPERVKAMKEGGQVIFEGMPAGKDGVVRPMELNARIISYDGRPVVFALARDITERKKAEEILKKTNEELLDKTTRLERFNRITLGREQRIMELKTEVNELLARLGEPKSYE